MRYAEYLERASAKIGAKFIEYRPESGAWVFEVLVILLSTEQRVLQSACSVKCVSRYCHAISFISYYVFFTYNFCTQKEHIFDNCFR